MSTSPFRSRQFMFPFCISWFVWICVHHLALYYLGIGWFTALTDSIVSNTLLIFVAMLIFTILRFYLPRNNGFINLLVWVIVLTAAWYFANDYLLHWFIKDETYHQLLHQSWPLRSAFGFLMCSMSTVIAYAYFNWQEKTETEKQKAETIQLNKETELNKLRQQLQPHFLFNSLNSINALIGTAPAQARTMVQQLSEFLRNTLRREEQQWTALNEELKTLQLYLEIEKVRFGNRLSTEIIVEEGCNDAKIPSMLLQPVMENAIKFGLYDTTEMITIQLYAALKNNQLEITIQNPFDAETGGTQKGTGFGLNSVSRRLFLLFGRTDLMHTETKGTTFITTITIPQQDRML
jgi:two-component system, LytTR family, sensor kinase